MADRPARSYDREVRHHSIWAYSAIATLVLGLGGWATLTEVAGAVIASGTLVVETSAKRVQHQEGGIIAEIDVRNDDRVEAGQVLLRLDDTTLRASLTVVNDQLDEATTLEARLLSEAAGSTDFAVPPLLGDRVDQPRVAELIRTQRDLQAVRRTVRQRNSQQLEEQIAQFEAQIAGFQSQAASVAAQIDNTGAELLELNDLLSAQLVGQARVNELARQKSQLESQQAAVSSSIAQTNALIAERRVMIDQIQSQFTNEVLGQLQSVREKIAELMQQRIAGEDRLARVALIAPQKGIVHESIVNTIGGVVAPGETLMMIVPTDDDLLVEIRLNPLDVDKVHVGQSVIVRIPGFNPRTSPDLPARVMQVAPDLTSDPMSGATFYLARVALDPETAGLLDGAQDLLPGMPAEAFIQTGSRTVLTYLLEPLTEQFRRAMRES